MLTHVRNKLPSKPAFPQEIATPPSLLLRSKPLESSLDITLFFQHTSKFASLHFVLNPKARWISLKCKSTELGPRLSSESFKGSHFIHGERKIPFRGLQSSRGSEYPPMPSLIQLSSQWPPCCVWNASENSHKRHSCMLFHRPGMLFPRPKGSLSHKHTAIRSFIKWAISIFCDPF